MYIGGEFLMGIWGTGIFSNDDSADVKCEYIALIGNGVDDYAALKAMKKYFKVSDNPSEKDADFWYALASLQYKYGRLSNEVKDMALQCIDKDFTLNYFITEKDIAKRRKNLCDLKAELLSENFQTKKAPKYKVKKALGNHGDVLAYHLINYSSEYKMKMQRKMYAVHHIDYTEEQLIDYCCTPWFIGKYVLLNVAGVNRWPISHAIPDLGFNECTVCSLYKWIGNTIPDISVVEGLEISPFEKLKQIKGGFNEHFFMEFEPKSVFHYKTDKYISNIGKDTEKVLYQDSAVVLVTNLEDELKCLFDNNKDIETEFKKYIDE